MPVENKKVSFYISLAVVSLLSFVVTMVIVNFLITTVFFDRFIFYKRIDYGYWLPNQSLSYVSFGERAQDIFELDKKWDSLQKGEESNVAGVSDDKEVFTVAVIGDSYTWGQGVKFPDTYTQLLEKKLGKVGNVEVLSIAVPGNSILDHVINLKKLSETGEPDFIIVATVMNDLLLNESSIDYYKGLDFFDECTKKGEPVWNLSNEETLELIGEEERGEIDPSGERPVVVELVNRVDASWKDEASMCLLSESIKKFPTEKTLFFITDEYWDIENLEVLKDNIRHNGKNMISIADYKDRFPYSIYFNKPEFFFYVSKKEVHPSKLSHRMYAKILFEQLEDKL